MTEHRPVETSLGRFFSDRVGGCAELPAVLDMLEGADSDRRLVGHVKVCEVCRLLVEDWSESTPLFDVDEAPGLMSSVATLSPPRRKVAISLAIAVIAAAIAIAVWTPKVFRGVTEPSLELTPRGNWSVHVAVRRGTETFRARPGQRLQNGDWLGFFYSADAPGYLHLLYVDEAGEKTTLFPIGDASGQVEPGHEVRLEVGAVLRDAQDCEAVIGLMTPEPVDDVQLAGMLEQLITDERGCLTATGPHAELQIFEVLR